MLGTRPPKRSRPGGRPGQAAYSAPPDARTRCLRIPPPRSPRSRPCPDSGRFTRILFGPSSLASERVIVLIAALLPLSAEIIPWLPPFPEAYLKRAREPQT